MILPEIRFQNIRPHENSRNIGFEELCCQLAALEPQPIGTTFVRKGRGGDAGVECFIQHVDGREIGWQAKYVERWSDTLKSQLDGSISTALDKHPALTVYVVCLPFDLPDARSGRGLTARGYWNKWVATWIAKATSTGRNLQIELWDASALTERLTRGNPAYAGRLLYWFGQEALTQLWMKQQFEKSRAALGSRYVPESNVELPIRQDFLSFVRDPSLIGEIEEWGRTLKERLYSAVSAAVRADAAGGAEHTEHMERELGTLIDCLDCSAVGLEAPYPVLVWANAAAQSTAEVRTVLGWAYGLAGADKKFDGASPVSWLQHELFCLADLLDQISAACASERWKLANLKRLLLVGEAGIGKSHLLADVVARQIAQGAPAILVLGSMFNDDEPWRQILTQLDLPFSMQVKHFLAALDSAAEAARMRALICVDALNERNGLDVWPDRLAVFLQTAEAFPRVAICVSCRTTYVDYIVPEHLDENALPRLTHQGFGGTAGEAAQRYLDMRGMVRPGAPNLLPEFNNPLFLKTCCDYLEKEGKTELPKGLQGVSAIFQFYVTAVVHSLTRRMQLDRRQHIVLRAIQRLTEAFVQAEASYLPVLDVGPLLDAFHASGGRVADSLMAQLESEGMLTIEPIRGEGDEVVDAVRFTFERFSDHQIAQRLLELHVDGDNSSSAFATERPLHEYIAGPNMYRHVGVIEALAIQLPQRFGLELPDLLPEGEVNWSIKQAFDQSLLWRDQSVFTARTLELVAKLLGTSRASLVLLEIATEPHNLFNARHLHKRLEAKCMALRDAQWSVFVAQHGDDEDGPIATLISWAHAQGMGTIDADRAELAAITLTWFLSTSARVIRDRATKALTCLLARRPQLAILLLQLFGKIDDLYVRERLFAAVYGAVLQGMARDEIANLAEAVYIDVFAKGCPPANALMREHARGVIRYAQWRNMLPPSIDMRMVEPPYKSAWPIEFVPDTVVDGYQQAYGKNWFHDDIVSSTGSHGDFGAYVIRPMVSHFSPMQSGMRLLRSEEICANWMEAFLSRATAEQLDAWLRYWDAAKTAKGEARWGDSPAKVELDAAERMFQATLSSDAWEGFRADARDYFIYSFFSGDGHYRGKATFNFAWACRWICKRAHEFGWTAQRFKEFESNDVRSTDRYDHRIERIGKKYQWLALHELAARMDDNLARIKDEYADDDDDDDDEEESESYAGAFELGLRDIDPSLLVRTTHYDGWRQWPKTWWFPAEQKLRTASPKERLAWKDSEIDIVNDSALIDVVDPQDGRHWLVLNTFADWRQSEVVKGKRVQQRSSWVRLTCLVVKKSDTLRLKKFLRQKRLTHPDQLPRLTLGSDIYIGEYPWHPSCNWEGGWWPDDMRPRMPVPVRPTVADYTRERAGYDYSLDKTVSVLLPAPWLIEAMDLRMLNGGELTYVDGNDRVSFFDPSVSQAGHQAALVDREAFLATLELQGLEAVWVIAGEKDVYGSSDPARSWGGTLAHSAVYRLVNGQFVRSLWFDRDESTKEQMVRYLEDDE
ncbi:MAG: hypothetical protein V4724_13315 [Pseudomonadota bacterium]